MMRIEKTSDGERLIALPTLKLADAAYKEVEHLQRMILSSPEAFFGEINEDLFVVGSEAKPRPEFVGDRIDILGLDGDGTAVVVELKRDRDKLQLLQSLTYAAMLRSWGLDDFAKEYAARKGLSVDAAREALAEFLGAGVQTINERQRVVLVAESFDYEVLATAEWLTEEYGVGIKCVRIALRADGVAHYMSAETIFPASPLSDHAWRRRAASASSGTSVPASSWDEVYAQVISKPVEDLARDLVSSLPSQDAKLKGPSLYIRVNGKRTVNVEVRRDFAYVWQARRFKNDHEFWTDRLGPEIDLQDVQGGRAFRFYLRTTRQCEAFLETLDLLKLQTYDPLAVETDAT